MNIQNKHFSKLATFHHVGKGAVLHCVALFFNTLEERRGEEYVSVTLCIAKSVGIPVSW